MQSLDELLDGTEPHATFHDASLRELRIDYQARTLAAVFELWVGDPDAELESERKKSRAGVLELTGVISWVQDPPDLSAAILSGSHFLLPVQRAGATPTPLRP
jgi:hypothetical protein